MNPQPSWNLISDVNQLLSFPFMVNALRAGTIVAIVAGAIGYFMVLRRESFAGHSLALVGFPGAAGASLLGIDAAFGYFGFCVVAALIVACLPSGVHSSSAGYGDQSAVIGTVQAFSLACGFLFISLYKGFLSGVNSLLFGTIIGVTSTQVVVLLISGAACLLVLAVIGRPLLFASIDPDVAGARGIRVRMLSAVFLVLLGVAAAGTSQVTGSLLVFALLVAPAATAARLSPRPAVGVVLSIAIALAVTWAGEAIAYFSPYPIGFWVTSLAFALYLLASGYQSAMQALGHRRGVSHRQRRETDA